MNYVQDRFANQTKEDHAEVVRLCCIIKPLVTWASENAISVCRERCGGQGYLAANRFGEGIAGAHAGITAEGDNRVIQQKVSKELLDMADFEAVGNHLKLRAQSLEAQHKASHVAGDNVGSAEWQKKLFKRRENLLLNELAGRMFLARQDGKHVFETWMLQESDNVQALATAYGENIAVEQFDKAIQQVQSPSAKATLQKLFSLYALDRVLTDGVFFLQNGVVNAKQTAAMTAEVQRLCTELGKDMLELTAAFGIPNHMHHAPIANNWEQYNANENLGELKDQTYRQSKL